MKSAKRPVWFVYAGMGSQWPGMGKQLLQFDVFKKSILQSHRILEQYGVDLLKIVMDEGSLMLENILHCFVGITAVMVRVMIFQEYVRKHGNIPFFGR